MKDDQAGGRLSERLCDVHLRSLPQPEEQPLNIWHTSQYDKGGGVRGQECGPSLRDATLTVSSQPSG